MIHSFSLIQKYCKSLKMVEIFLIFKTASDSNMRLKRGEEAGRRGEAGWKGRGYLPFYQSLLLDKVNGLWLET